MSHSVHRCMRILAERQHGVITQAQAFELGATEKLLRHECAAGRMERAGRLVYRFTGTPVTDRQRLLIAQLAAGPGAVASHRSAAALLGIPGFSFKPIELTAPRGARPRVRGARIRQSAALLEHHLRIAEGINTTSYARTLFDLCGSVHPLRAERALDNCLTRRFVTVPACWRVVADLAEHGRGGTVLIREILTARGEGYVAPASELEAELLRVLRDAGLPAPAREIDLGDTDGWVGRVELVFRETHVLIEADSRLHHSSLLDRRADRARDDRFEADGWDVLRFTWEQITQRPDEVVRLVRSTLRAAA